MANTITLSPEEQEDIYFGVHSGYGKISGEWEGESRWSTYWAMVFRDPADDKFYQFTYETPATEMQEDMDRYEVEAFEVEPYQATVTKYRKVTA